MISFGYVVVMPVEIATADTLNLSAADAGGVENEPALTSKGRRLICIFPTHRVFLSRQARSALAT